MKTKKFDCVAMKHRGAARIAQKLVALSQQQELAFWQQQTQELKKQQQNKARQQGANPQENLISPHP